MTTPHRSRRPRATTRGDTVVRRARIGAETRIVELSRCGRYRWRLTVVFDETRPLLRFVGLNPSTADEQTDDPTLRRCKAFARRLGFGGVIVTNLFALRATHPRALRAAADPVGGRNTLRFLERAGGAVIVAAWGDGGRLAGRAARVREALRAPWSFGCTRRGEPRHPLYLPRDARLVPLTGAATGAPRARRPSPRPSPRR